MYMQCAYLFCQVIINLIKKEESRACVSLFGFTALLIFVIEFKSRDSVELNLGEKLIQI